MARNLLSLGISAPTNSGRVSGDTLPPDASRSLELAAQDSDFHTFATRAVELARILTGASGSAIAFREAEGTICRARSGQGAPRIGARVDATAGISKQCLDSGTALYCADTETDVRINPEAARGLGIRSVAVVPVRKNGEDGDICGILEVFSDRPGVFSERHLKTLHHLAVLVGTAGQPNGAKDLATTLQASPEISADPTSPVAPAPESTKAGFAIHSHLPSAKFPVTPAAPPTMPSVVPEKPISADVVPQAESERPPSTQAAFSGSPFSKSPSLESAPAASTSATTDAVQPAPEVAAPKIAAKDASVSQSPNQLALLPQTESPRSVFLSNLAIVFAKEPPRSRARTSVPQRWNYVPLDSHIPLTRFFQSIALHVIVIASVAGLVQIWPRSISFEARRRERITYYPFSAAAQVRPRTQSSHSTRMAVHNKVRNAKPAAESQAASAANPDSAPPESASSGNESKGASESRVATPPAPSIDGVGSRSPQLPIAVAVLPPPPDIGSVSSRQLNSSAASIVAPPPEVGGSYASRTLNRPNSGIIPPTPETRALAGQSARVSALGSGIVPPPPSVNNSAALAYAGAVAARPGVQVVAPPPSISGGSRLAPGGSISLGAKASQIVPPPPSLQEGGSASRNRQMGSLSGSGASIVPPPPAIETVGSRNGKGVGSIAGNGNHIVPPPPSVQVAGNRNGTGVGSLGGTGSGIVPPPPTVGRGTGARGGSGLGSLSGVASGIVPPPPSIQGTGGRGGIGIGSLSGAGSGIVPPPPSVNGSGGRGGAGVGSLAGNGAGVVPPPPGMQGLGSRGGGGLGSLGGNGSGIVPPPPSLGNGTGSGGNGGNGLAGLGSQVVPPPVSLDGAGNGMGGSGRAASMARPSVEVVAPRSDPRAPNADIPTNTAPAAADNNLQPTFQNVQLRLIVSAWAPPRSSYFSSFEVFIAQKWLNKETPQLIKLVYEFLPYQRRLSEFSADSWKVRKLRVVRDPKCDESLMQIEWPEGPNGRPGLVQSDNSQLPLPADRDAPLPCYRTTADDYRRAVSSH